MVSAWIIAFFDNELFNKINYIFLQERYHMEPVFCMFVLQYTSDKQAFQTELSIFVRDNS